MESVASLSYDRLRELLHYDPETGQFVWRVSPSAKVAAGALAGGPNKAGYITIGIGGRRYKAHRLAWLYMTGEWPAEQIDHVNTVRDDNRWANLREATHIQNQRNRRSVEGKSVPFKGVRWNKSRSCYYASIRVNRKVICLPQRRTAEEAYNDYVAAASKYFGEFARVD